MSLSERLQLGWSKVVGNYESLGPSARRMAALETEAELFGANAFARRCLRLLWIVLAAGSLLWLMRELGMRPAPRW